MKLSAKSRYAVMAMVELAHEDTGGKPLTLAEISSRQILPLQYLEQLFVKLRKAGLVKSTRGQKGGYFLGRSSHLITIADVVKAVGEEMQTTNCKTGENISCRGTNIRCKTHNLWSGLGYVMTHYLRAVTLEDVLEQRLDGKGMILTANRPLLPDMNTGCA